jgi:hypothetical protein
MEKRGTLSVIQVIILILSVISVSYIIGSEVGFAMVI